MNSTTPTCPQCRTAIPDDDVNVGKGVAYCRRCRLLHDLSALMESAELDFAPELTTPPKGTWLREDGFGTVVGATHRSIGAALGVAFFMLFWNGLVSVFVTFATISTLQHFGMPRPAWMQHVHGTFPQGGGLIFIWLFLTPFILIGLSLIFAFLSSLFGRTEVRLREEEGVVYVGIGPFGYRRRFNAAAVRSVKVAPGSWTKNNQPQYVIHLESEGCGPIKFGSMLREDRKRYLAAEVHRLTRMRAGGMGAPSTFAPPAL